MKTQPTISVIVPIYNVEKYLKTALSSLKKQSYHDFEVIMINDGSNDHSCDIAKEFLDDPRFNLINSNKNEGLSAARNKGISHATSELIYFFDPDDVLPTNLFESLINYFTDDIDLISFNYCSLNDKKDNNISDIRQSSLYSQNDAFELLLENKINVAPWSYIFRRDLLKNPKVRFPEGRIFEDITFNPLLLNQTRKIKVIEFEQAGYFYRACRADSITNDRSTNRKFEKQMEDRLYLYKRKYQFLVNCTNVNKKIIANWFIQELIGTYIEYYKFSFTDKRKLRSKIFTSYIQELKKYKSQTSQLNFKTRIKYLVLTNPILRNIWLFTKRRTSNE